MSTMWLCYHESRVLCYLTDYNFLLTSIQKLVLIGDSGVGKSCLLLRFAVCSAISCVKNYPQLFPTHFMNFYHYRMMHSLNHSSAQLE